MNFVSLTFLLFLVITFILYYAIPKKWQWILLLVASMVFYIWAGWVYVIYLLASIVVTYSVGLGIEKLNDLCAASIDGKEKDEIKAIKKSFENKKGWVLAAGIVVNITILVVVKYLDFILTSAVSIINLLGGDVQNSALNIALPLGLSFYTFQSLGYCIDVKRGTIKAQKNLFKYALFVSFFPQLLQGPIGRYDRLAPQLFEEHKIEYNNVFLGTQRIILGFFKKLAVADVVGVFVDAIFSSPTNAYGFVGALGAIGYAVQLFADFSGFMDIAIGSAKLFGITLDENFNSPYLSTTVAGYWRRWHISLGAFFRDYIYYPILRGKVCTKLLKNKNKKLGSNLATAIALLTTWLLIGLWHGASWNYVLHGLYYGVIITLGILLEPTYKIIREKLKLNVESVCFKCFQVLRTLIIVCFGYILFRTQTLTEFGNYISAMFSGSGINEITHFDEVFGLNMELEWLYVVEIVITTIIWIIVSHNMNNLKAVDIDGEGVSVWKKMAMFNCVVMIAIAVVAYIMVNSLGGVSGGFIYYSF